MVNITMLGCGGNVPSPSRFCSCSLINYKGKKILIDCGEGTQISMKNLGTGFKGIDLVLITHLHGDHINGLLGLLSSLGNAEKRDPLIIVGPKGIKRAIKAMMILWEGLPYGLNVIENPIGKFSVNMPIYNEIEIDVLELEHSVECLGYSLYFKRNRSFSVKKALFNNVPKSLWKNLQKGQTFYYNNKTYTPDMVLDKERKGIKLTYVTDTRPIKEIETFAKDSSIFICEAMYSDDMDIGKAVKNKHMTFRETCNLANKSNSKKLLLTHFSPSVSKPELFEDFTKSLFKNSIIAYDGITIEIPYED
ncbi:ribonuclease Z [Peptostreptococcus equinus]|uniref:Ribonuclease Z n=1 Tax=Peptostreptococcus equinus TaxID=3003601 RepID=A0ABY7JP73_9FIRM|nr:ribonuclease Z [Peptostreptococcus sp. CBA3647]WAW14279.1 ribonuclease Z [Peptostreptococcus sp. CBA3647]